MTTLMRIHTNIPMTARCTATSILMLTGTSTCTNISTSTPIAGRPSYTTMTTRATTALMTMTIPAMKRKRMLMPTEISMLQMAEFSGKEAEAAMHPPRIVCAKSRNFGKP